MKDADQMTPEELRALADQKETELYPVKYAKLKQNLYYFNIKNDVNKLFSDSDWLITEDEKNNFIDKIKSLITIELQKGTPFVCYMENGEEFWYDDVNYGVDGMCSDWADKHLINIKNGP